MNHRRNVKAATPQGKMDRGRKKKRRKTVSAEKDKGHGGANHLQQADVVPVSFLNVIPHIHFAHSSFHTGARGTCLMHDEEEKASARRAEVWKLHEGRTHEEVLPGQ